MVKYYWGFEKYYCLGRGCMRRDYHEIIFGSFFLIYSMVYYLTNPSFYSIPSIFFYLTVIVSGVFELKKYYNKYAYMVFIVVILVVMWLFNFIQPLSPNDNIVGYYVMVGLSTLLILGLVILTFKRWIKNEKKLRLGV